MPMLGVYPVNVPGAVSAWQELNRLHGRLPLSQVLAPAIDYAKRHKPVAETVSYHWQQAAAFYDKDDPLFQSWFDTFTTNGRAPQAGELFCLPDHAATLETIGRDPDAFYRGVLAEKMTDFLQENGGYLTKEDMASFQPEWVDPIGVDYRGYEVLEIPRTATELWRCSLCKS